MDKIKERPEQTVTITRPEFNSLVYGSQSVASEIHRLRKENREMREKLNLVEGLLELRHLQGPGYPLSPDEVWSLEKHAKHMEMKYSQAASSTQGE